MAKKIKKVEEVNNFFCSGVLRPDCLKPTNLCCLKCDIISKCQTLNRSKVKPCTAKVCSAEETCEFSI